MHLVETITQPSVSSGVTIEELSRKRDVAEDFYENILWSKRCRTDKISQYLGLARREGELQFIYGSFPHSNVELVLIEILSMFSEREWGLLAHWVRNIDTESYCLLESVIKRGIKGLPALSLFSKTWNELWLHFRLKNLKLHWMTSSTKYATAVR